VGPTVISTQKNLGGQFDGLIIIRHCSNTRSGAAAYPCDSRGVLGAIGGGQMKKISKLANARHNPLHKSVNVYPAVQVALGCTPVPAAF